MFLAEGRVLESGTVVFYIGQNATDEQDVILDTYGEAYT